MQIDENNKFNKVCSIFSMQRDSWRCSLFGRSQRPPIAETSGSAIRHISPYYLPSYVNSVSRHIYHTPYNIQWFCVRTNYGREVFNGKYISITLNFLKTRWLKLPGGVVLIFNVRCEGYIPAKLAKSKLVGGGRRRRRHRRFRSWIVDAATF